jgi:hypothetical protein
MSYAESIKKWRKITTTTKKQIQSWPFIYKPGEHRQQSKGKKSTQIYEPNEFDRMRVKQFLSETVAMHPQYWSRVVRVSSTNPIPYASDAMLERGMVFIPESEVFFVCSAIVFKAFQRGPTQYFLQKKILFHVNLIKMLFLISLFLRFSSYFPQNSG